MTALTPVTEKERKLFNSFATHPLQSYEWGEFRKQTGINVVRKILEEHGKPIGSIQLTIHPVPRTSWTIGYLPKGTKPTPALIQALKTIGKEYNCIFIQLEPNIFYEDLAEKELLALGLRHAAHPLFTQYTFQLDLTQSEEELLKNMHSKTRYNIKVAQKHHVEITEETGPAAFETYWKLTEETTKRQGFYAHTKRYHELMWQTLGKKNPEGLEAHLFVGTYVPDGQTEKVPLVTWVLFTFKDFLYYPYGASSQLYRNVMASNLMMWEAITFGKRHGLKTFDMWGSLGENPDTKDPWYGFHRLKMGYGPRLVKFVGSYDLVLQPFLYEGYKLADKVRWLLLRLR